MWVNIREHSKFCFPIGKWAFSNTRLAFINIPNSVTSIGDYAFDWLNSSDGCFCLTDVTVNWEILRLVSNPFGTYTNVSNINPHVRDATPIFAPFYHI
ncbi:MAG: leucine-rich repeat domain-containing protein, partial [Lentimicrobiaceae bacterium]|nr:leucine-rich repeat domain-containing protein [Lentimicrobiaceae bacterium]